MNKKCIGCGEILQTIDKTKEGYVSSKKYEEALLCERCFKIKHYGESYVIDKKPDMTSLINRLNRQRKNVLFLIDSITINNEVLDTIKELKTNTYVVITKRDLLPKSVRDYKLINYITENTGKDKVLVISSKKKNGIDELYNKLYKDGIKEIYVLGYTNAGKSTLINTILESKGKKSTITVSSNPNTTTEEIKMKIDDITFIDTPGFVSENSIINYIDLKDYKGLLPKREIKPKIHTLKKGFMILLGDIIRIENNSEDTSLIFYFNNDIKLEKMHIERNERLKDLDKTTLRVSLSEDIVVFGVGFIKIGKEANLDIYIANKNVISKRKKLI